MNWLIESMKDTSTPSGMKKYLERVMEVQEYQGVFFITETNTDTPGVLVAIGSTEEKAWDKAIIQARHKAEEEALGGYQLSAGDSDGDYKLVPNALHEDLQSTGDSDGDHALTDYQLELYALGAGVPSRDVRRKLAPVSHSNGI